MDGWVLVRASTLADPKDLVHLAVVEFAFDLFFC